MPQTTPERSSADRVAGDLHRQIRQGRWPAGSRLPTTRQLAQRFGVSLSSVQGALRELEAQDLIGRRPRVGSFVKAPQPRTGSGGRSSRQSRQVAVILPGGKKRELSQLPGENSWTHDILHAAQHTFAQAGYHLMLISDLLDQWEARIEQAVTDLAGVISFVDPGIQRVLRRLDEHRVPWITINALHARMMHNFVSADNFSGGRLVGRCFARLGFERVLFLGDDPAKASTAGKMHGFLQGYIDLHRPLREIEYDWAGGPRDEQGYASTCRYLDRIGPPQGIFAAGGDFIAVGAIRALRDRGIEVPAHTGVVGGTGLMFGEYSHPPLTTLAQPMEPMGHAAAEMLLSMIDHDQHRTTGRYVPSYLLVRGSLSITDEDRRMIEQDQQDIYAQQQTPAGSQGTIA